MLSQQEPFLRWGFSSTSSLAGLKRLTKNLIHILLAYPGQPLCASSVGPSQLAGTLLAQVATTRTPAHHTNCSLPICCLLFIPSSFVPSEQNCVAKNVTSATTLFFRSSWSTLITIKQFRLCVFSSKVKVGSQIQLYKNSCCVCVFSGR